ncbi:MAG: DNA topoisomerase [Gallionella sp.]|nr:DNA topoisomerase [Gallionella sp.]
MSEHHTSAHPILEPLDYELTPDDARLFMKGELLDVYELLWSAGVATAMDGPALRREILEVQLRTSTMNPTSDSSLGLLAVQMRCLDQGWSPLLTSETQYSEVGAPNIAAFFPDVLTDALDACGQAHIDGNGRRYRSADMCTQLATLLGRTATWETEVTTLTDPALSLDQVIELMEKNGIGRPSTFADRLSAAIDNDLVRHNQATNRLEIGDYGEKVLAALTTLPASAVVDAAFSADLEMALKAIETDHSLAGDIVRQFCERALGTDSSLADWLDEQVIDGESLNESIARADAILPSANSWSSFALPAGMSPEQLAIKPDEAISLRAEIDTILAAPDRNRWKRRSPRQRAACRLAVLAMASTTFSAEGLVALASRDIVLRWWIDLAPQEAPLSDDEFEEIQVALLMLDPVAKADLAALAVRVDLSL